MKLTLNTKHSIRDTEGNETSVPCWALGCPWYTIVSCPNHTEPRHGEIVRGTLQAQRVFLHNDCTCVLKIDFQNASLLTFHRCRRFGRLALTDRSVGHGRYRRSVRFHLQDNTVDIDGRFGYTYGELRSISTVGSVHSTQKLVDIDHIVRFIQRFIYSVFTKDTLDEKGQPRNTSTHVTFNALNSTKNFLVAAGWNPQLLANWIGKKKLSKRCVWPKKGLN